MTDDDAPYAELERVEWRVGTASVDQDRVAREEPLEIRIGGAPIAVVMRTPGHDRELVTGFLLSERIVARIEDVVSVRHCTTVDTPSAEDNVVQAVLRTSVDLASLRRNFFASSSCGVCGKASIDQAMGVAGPVEGTMRLQPEQLYTLPARLEAEQPTFAQTGGLHGAALFDARLQTIAVREDVGRHNAVDKVLGAAARSALGGRVLLVSGRVSFEITQKALACGVEVVAAVSAPSSLAVDLARRGNMTLVGFLRDRRMCVYAGHHRIGLEDG